MWRVQASCPLSLCVPRPGRVPAEQTKGWWWHRLNEACAVLRMEGCALVKQSVCSEALQIKIPRWQLSCSTRIWSFWNFYLWWHHCRMVFLLPWTIVNNNWKPTGWQTCMTLKELGSFHLGGSDRDNCKETLSSYSVSFPWWNWQHLELSLFLICYVVPQLT